MYLTQPIHKAARERPDALVTVFGERRQSAARFAERVARLAAGLTSLGIEPGDRVAIMALNSDRYLETIFATFWAGGVLNPVNIRWSPQEVAYSLNDCDTRVLIVDATFAPLVPKLRDLVPSLAHVLALDAPGAGEDYEAMVEGNAPAADAVRRGDELAAILYTGGTTGLPKGVMLSHTQLALNAMGVTAGTQHAGDLPALHVSPLFHVAGMTAVFQYAQRGAPQVLLPAFDPSETLRLIEEEAIADVFLVPTMLRRVIDHPDLARRQTTSLKTIRYGAAPIDTTLLRRAMAAFPQARFLQLYGQTECGPCVTQLAPEDHADPDAPRIGSAGKPLPMAEVRLEDAEGADVPPGEVGEICVRGPSLMLGYWNKPQETAAALRKGWMHTGDAGRFDADGFLTIVDRTKDMIITGGENVYSTEVENALATAQGVGACAVIAVPDETWGERVHAVVVPAGERPREADLEAHCRALIATYKVPKSFEFVDELPLSPAGKVLKTALRERWWGDRGRRVS